MKALELRLHQLRLGLVEALLNAGLRTRAMEAATLEISERAAILYWRSSLEQIGAGVPVALRGPCPAALVVALTLLDEARAEVRLMALGEWVAPCEDCEGFGCGACGRGGLIGQDDDAGELAVARVLSEVA